MEYTYQQAPGSSPICLSGKLQILALQNGHILVRRMQILAHKVQNLVRDIVD
jgi:hypothetical protein